MARLGYARYVAQGGDWGATVTTAIGIADTAHCAGIHLNMPIAAPTRGALDNLDRRASRRAIAGWQHYREWDSGYSKQQSTRPQTLGYGLADSPAGQAAWILEKFWAWTDCDGHPENALTRDELLDNVMLYWLPATGASSARLYWESFAHRHADRCRRHRADRLQHLPEGDLPHARGAGPRSATRTSSTGTSSSAAATSRRSSNPRCSSNEIRACFRKVRS